MFKTALFIVGGLASAAIIIYALTLALGSTNGQVTPSSNGSLAVDSLKFLVVVSRHGNRGSNFDYPGDPYPMKDTRYWPYGADGLTPKGRTEMYNLGVKVRSLYSGFIPVSYRSEDIRASSTKMDRLLMSGEAFLEGLYPPRGFQIFKSGLDWQPTALYSDSPDRTIELYINKTECPTFTDRIITIMAELSQKYAPTFKNVSAYVQNVTGVDPSIYGTHIGFMLWDKISNEISEGLTVPEWTHEFYPDLLTSFISEEYRVITGSYDKATRLVAGEMFEEMLTAMIQKANGSLTPDRRMLFYSGHDTTIVALQRIIGVSYDSMVGIVRPGSALVLELHQKNETQPYYVQARFIDGTDMDKTPLVYNITSDFSSFVNSSQKFIHVNFEQECKDFQPETTKSYLKLNHRSEALGLKITDCSKRFQCPSYWI